MPFLKPLLLVFLLFLTYHNSLAQNIVKIQVNNAQKTNEPIVGATVQIIGKKYFMLSNEEGFLSLIKLLFIKKTVSKSLVSVFNPELLLLQICCTILTCI
ncbi:hypothetical protein BWI92_16255 [Flectobacillus sp. BAB-3569]|nr:hypothetical protein BWI92_16255 [Flectobacillus sp. BAB-3569]